MTEIDELNNKIEILIDKRVAIAGRIHMIEDEVHEARERLDEIDTALFEANHELGLLDGRWVKTVCLRCNGSGTISSDTQGKCYICGGIGYHTAVVWISKENHIVKHDTRPMDYTPRAKGATISTGGIE